MAEEKNSNLITEQEEKEPAVCPHCSRHKERTSEEQKALITRLKKVEGQIRGIEKMVENDAYCPDILIQVSAATSALNSFNKLLLQCHIRSCVAEDIRAGSDEAIDELCNVLQKLMK
ncbi:MAG: metal-sensing transcriptional repressor [Eubacteriales bacterium]|nr:metal-sensing transcriptional repressor [Eubacteriales bacterium]